MLDSGYNAESIFDKLQIKWHDVTLSIDSDPLTFTDPLANPEVYCQSLAKRYLDEPNSGNFRDVVTQLKYINTDMVSSKADYDVWEYDVSAAIKSREIKTNSDLN